jgi:hypothetical protein
VSQADEEDSSLPPEREAELLAALEAAWRPSELDPRVHERLLELALEDPLAPPSEQELVEAGRLRDALAGGPPHEDARLLAALGAPFGEDATTEAVERALGAALGAGGSRAPRRRGNVIYAAFGAASVVVAVAAAVALVVGLPRGEAPARADASTLIKPHSTAELFADRFETADTTARVDLIASARGRDLRDNRFAAWGVP